MAEKDDRAASAAESTRPIIKLEAIAGPAAYVEVDGERHDMAATASFGLIERSRVTHLLERVAKLEALSEPTAEDAAEYERRLRELAPIVLPSAPAETLAKLAVGQLADLAVAFFAYAAKTSPRIAMVREMAATPSPTGTTSSPGSSGSMGETPEPGS